MRETGKLVNGLRRRTFLIAAGAVCAAPLARAQTPVRVRRIGYLSARAQPNELDAAFRAALRDLGYFEGRSLQIEYRWGAASEAQAATLAAELVARNVEVIVTATTAAIRGAMRATKRIPIVMAASADPVGAGLVASLARPGGNVTGLTLVSNDTAAKRLELLRLLVPGAKRVAILLEGTSSPGSGDQVNSLLIAELQAAARELGLSVTVQGMTGAGEIDGAFEAIARGRAQALLVQASRLSIDNRARIVELAARHRLPAMYEVEGFVSAGGLLSYGPSLADMYRRAAGYVDRILRGTPAADLPVERPNKYELVINVKTARALALRVPQELLLRADRLIE